MQNRYAFDFGDFGKFSLLRTLAPGRRVGLCWYLCTGGPREPEGDGRFIGYLKEPRGYEHLDPTVFNAFASGFTGQRGIQALEALDLVPGAVYHGAHVPRDRQARRQWFAELLSAIDRCDLVLTDPDNGFEPGRLSPKSIAWDEVEALLRPGRALLLYHHRARSPLGSRRASAAVQLALLLPGRRR